MINTENNEIVLDYETILPIITEYINKSNLQEDIYSHIIVNDHRYISDNKFTPLTKINITNIESEKLVPLPNINFLTHLFVNEERNTSIPYGHEIETMCAAFTENNKQTICFIIGKLDITVVTLSSELLDQLKLNKTYIDHVYEKSRCLKESISNSLEDLEEEFNIPISIETYVKQMSEIGVVIHHYIL